MTHGAHRNRSECRIECGILYLGIMVQIYIGLPAPALPFKIVYEAASWVACIALLRGCRRFAVSAWPGEAGAALEYRLFRA